MIQDKPLVPGPRTLGRRHRMRRMQRGASTQVFELLNLCLMGVLVVITLYPMLMVLFSSFSDPLELAKAGGVLIMPKGFTLKGYELVMQNNDVWMGYQNTLFYVLVGTTLNVSLTSGLAFALSRKKPMLRSLMTTIALIPMFFGGGMIPTYLCMRDLGLLDTRFIVILPGLVSTSNLIIMRTNFQGIPDSLEESAHIDGANDLQIFFRIILPLSIPVVAVMILFYGVGHWNSWFNAMVYLRSRQRFPLQLFLREIIILSSTEEMMGAVDQGMRGQNLSEVIKYATIVIATLPILCVYPFLQKYFVKGVMIGALKG